MSDDGLLSYEEYRALSPEAREVARLRGLIDVLTGAAERGRKLASSDRLHGARAATARVSVTRDGGDIVLRIRDAAGAGTPDTAVPVGFSDAGAGFAGRGMEDVARSLGVAPEVLARAIRALGGVPPE